MLCFCVRRWTSARGPAFSSCAFSPALLAGGGCARLSGKALLQREIRALEGVKAEGG